MRTVKSEFKDVFKAPMEEEGFTYAGNTFYRHVNDVLQTFTLRKTCCTLHFRFGIFPVCIPISEFLPCGILYPVERYVEGRARPFSYPYEPKDVRGLMEQGLEVVKREAIPVFRSGIDCKSAYDTVVNAQSRMFTGDPNRMVLHDICLRWMALKNKDYEHAYVHHISMIALNLGLIRHETILADLLQPEVRERLETITENDSSRLIELKTVLHHIMQKDDDFFQALIDRNTQITLSFLEKVRKSPCKYGKGDCILF